MFSDSLFLSIPNSYKFRTLPIQKLLILPNASRLYTQANSVYLPLLVILLPVSVIIYAQTFPNTRIFIIFFLRSISYGSSKDFPSSYYFPTPSNSLSHTVFQFQTLSTPKHPRTHLSLFQTSFLPSVSHFPKSTSAGCHPNRHIFQ